MHHEHTGDEWIDLTAIAPITAFSISGMVTMNNEGAGRAVLASVIDAERTAYHFILDPELAGRIGFELIGTATGHLQNFIEDHFDPDPYDEDDDD
jgi:hypothetical protein